MQLSTLPLIYWHMTMFKDYRIYYYIQLYCILCLVVNVMTMAIVNVMTATRQVGHPSDILHFDWPSLLRSLPWLHQNILLPNLKSDWHGFHHIPGLLKRYEDSSVAVITSVSVITSPKSLTSEKFVTSSWLLQNYFEVVLHAALFCWAKII